MNWTVPEEASNSPLPFFVDFISIAFRAAIKMFKSRVGETKKVTVYIETIALTDH